LDTSLRAVKKQLDTLQQLHHSLHSAGPEVVTPEIKSCSPLEVTS
jgi:hypothetical protein